MADQHPPPDLPLGKITRVPETYAPEVLYPIARATSRAMLNLPAETHGADLWHAYELSWLDATGRPAVRVGRFRFPADSPCMVESKSLKLYLNSLNNHRVANQTALCTLLARDLSAAAGAGVAVELLMPDDPQLAGTRLSGECIDTVALHDPAAPIELAQPAAELLRTEAHYAEERLYSHLLRSLCPVTGQPDWASVWVHYSGRALAHDSLLAYLLSYRLHREFHEQCVERIFADLHRACAPEQLTVQAFFTRRGGLDINPLRSTEADAQPLPRLDRQ